MKTKISPTSKKNSPFSIKIKSGSLIKQTIISIGPQLTVPWLITRSAPLNIWLGILWSIKTTTPRPSCSKRHLSGWWRKALRCTSCSTQKSSDIRLTLMSGLRLISTEPTAWDHFTKMSLNWDINIQLSSKILDIIIPTQSLVITPKEEIVISQIKNFSKSNLRWTCYQKSASIMNWSME